MPVQNESVVALADDLSGACEVSSALGGLPVILSPVVGPLPRQFVLDLGSRELPADEHRLRLRSVLAQHRDCHRLFVKTDSLLRGHVVETLDEALRLGRPILFSPALPALGRRVVNGVLNIEGRPLHLTNLWSRERRPVPLSLGDLLADLPHRVVPSPEAKDLVPGRVTVTDLADGHAAQVQAELALSQNAILVGASALASGLRSPRGRRILVVIGTAAELARRQVAALSDERGLLPITLPTDVGATWAQPQLRRPVEVLCFENSKLVEPEAGPRLAASMASLVAGLAISEPLDLVLIGGETASAVLKQLEILRLEPLGEVHPGAVLSIAEGGLIATRPGSFGDHSSLLEIVSAIEATRIQNSERIR